MQLKTASAPSTARRMEGGSVTSPFANSAAAGSTSRARAGSRTRATTVSPRAANRCATAFPILPVAPVTSIRTARAHYWLLLDCGGHGTLPGPATSAFSTPERLDPVRPEAGAVRRAAVHRTRAGPAVGGDPRRRRAITDRRGPEDGRRGARWRLLSRPRGGRGRPHGDRAAPDRAGRAGGRKASHRSFPQRSGGNGRRALRPRSRGVGYRAHARRGGAAHRAGRAPQRLGHARLHASSARAAGLPRSPPPGVLLDASP